MITFNPSPEPTIGVEIELQLIDSTSLDMKNVAPEALKSVHPHFRGRIKEEFLQSMIELNTGICSTVGEVEDDIRESISHLEEILRPLNASYVCTSLHPFAKGISQKLTDNPRYRRIMNDLQIIGRRFIAQGLHVHIGIDGPERAIAVNNTMRTYLPLLLALTTSSPFYESQFTGLYSYRTKLFEALPLAGMPDSLDGWDEFNHVTMLLQKGGYIESVKDLWWDVRPHPDFGTVEVRVCDLPCRLKEILFITALIQALVVTISKMQIQPDTHIQILRQNKWQAARYGLGGVFVDPHRAVRLSMPEAIVDIVQLVQPEAQRLGSSRYLETVDEILENGTCAERLKKMYDEKRDFRSMIQDIQQSFYK
jgi:carboxylate-amine ligase